MSGCFYFCAVNKVSTVSVDKDFGWADAWQDKAFRAKLITACFLAVSILLILPHFFAMIEKRDGIVLHDWILSYLPARDFSVLVFIIIWSFSVLVLVRAIQQPQFLLSILFGMIGLLCLRMVTIYLVPLNPPVGLITMQDPLTSLTYGGRNLFITKDLFFSGHTSNLFLFYLCLQKRGDKLAALLGTLTIAILVLVQHVHYCIDVAGAFLFTYLLVIVLRKYSII